ncbi:MAG: thioesterase family protein [Sulfobacillus sp.]
MRPFAGGEGAEMEFTVEPGMEASFGGQVIHPVLSTWALVHHLEWVSRRLLVDHFEPGEEGAGAGVSIRHLAPAPIGSVVRVKAVARPSRPGHLTTDVEATAGGRLVAQGQVFQAIWPADELHRRMAEPPEMPQP